MRFTFATAGRIAFGAGASREVLDLPLGPRVLVVTGATVARADWLTEGLAARGMAVTVERALGEPTLPDLLAALARVRATIPDAVIAIGGGAALDLGKALAGLVHVGDPMDHLEVVGRGLPLTAPVVPLVAIPTTFGTGSEVTRNAVIGVPAAGRKVSLRDPRLLPAHALVDPDLGHGLPWAVTLASGLDAITQVIEPFVSPFATPLTDALCCDAIPRGLAALRRLGAGEDAGARSEMAWVSLCGGMALANARLGAVHGLAGVIGGRTAAAHGALCGRLLPRVLGANTAATGGARLAAVAGWIGAAFGVPATGAVAALERWIDAAGLPRLAALGVDAADHHAIAAAAGASSSMAGNPVVLDHDTLAEILAAS